LRKVSIVVAAAAALLCFAAVALAQTNTYTVNGKIAGGGSKKKPKPVGVQFGYGVGTAEGTLASPVKTYKIHLDGVKGNADFVSKKCAASKLNAMSTPDDSSCPSASKVGSGSVEALVGTAGTPITADTIKCHLDLRIYAGTKKSLTLFLHGEQPSCIASINQAIDAKLTTDATGGSLTFTVPPVLLHPVTGLDSGITQVTSTIKKFGTGKKALFYSDGTGCKGKRQVEVTFTDETGASAKTSAPAGNC
jgi:hypothetical protein